MFLGMLIIILESVPQFFVSENKYSASKNIFFPIFLKMFAIKYFSVFSPYTESK